MTDATLAELAQKATAGQRCPCCGVPVRVVSTDEGTSHYKPIPDPALLARVQAAEAVVAAARAVHDLAGSEPHPPFRPDWREWWANYCAAIERNLRSALAAYDEIVR